MNNALLKLGKTVAGVTAAVIVGELVAIGANAAVDDAGYLVRKAKDTFGPEPVQPKGFFKRRK
jgi:hypothetical protein